MNNEQIEKGLIEAIHLLAAAGAPLTTAAIANLEFLVTLIEEWNVRSGLVSPGELVHLWERHIFDSLSLVPYLSRYSADRPQWLDIGPGGGFPLLPCKLVLPALPVITLERTQKKVAYLQFAIAQMQMEQVSLVHGSFPEGLPKDARPGVITARAVEKPEVIVKSLVPLIKGGSYFLCQQPEVPEVLTRMFHVEQIQDEWGEKGLRRGELWIIKAR